MSAKKMTIDELLEKLHERHYNAAHEFLLAYEAGDEVKTSRDAYHETTIALAVIEECLNG